MEEKTVKARIVVYHRVVLTVEEDTKQIHLIVQHFYQF